MEILENIGISGCQKLRHKVYVDLYQIVHHRKKVPLSSLVNEFSTLFFSFSNQSYFARKKNKKTKTKQNKKTKKQKQP